MKWEEKNFKVLKLMPCVGCYNITQWGTSWVSGGEIKHTDPLFLIFFGYFPSYLESSVFADMENVVSEHYLSPVAILNTLLKLHIGFASPCWISAT